MNTTEKILLCAETEVNAPIEKVWKLWTTPEDIMLWNAPSDDWYTANVENNVHAGGKFLFEMASRDGNSGFDYTGVYEKVSIHRLIAHTLTDGRKTTITFGEGTPVKITETFEAADDLPADMQRSFCQAVLDRFKKYAESKL